MKLDKFVEQLNVIARKYFYEPSLRDNRIVLSRSQTLLTVPIEFYEDEVAIYLYARTTSWDGAGDRTDMNDVFSMLPALFVRVSNLHISSKLLDLEHPLGQGDDGVIREVELYARYITFSQPHKGGFLPRSKASLETIDHILEAITEYEVSLYHFIESDSSQNDSCDYTGLDLHVWAVTLAKALNQNIKSDGVLYNKRVNPSWLYFRSLSHKLSVIRAPKTAYMLRELVKNTNFEKTHSSDGYSFYINKPTLNAFKDDEATILLKVWGAIGESIDSLCLIPIDNKLIAIGEMHIAFLDCSCDTREYHQGRREVIARRKREQEILFDGGVYKWSERIDGERFEEFTRELLICKSGVVKVSNTSVTNEPDSNADLICIWDTVDLSDMPQFEAKSPIKRRKIVVQCKAWSKNIGKNDIPSIRDTLDRFDADGMLVVSSKSITRSLFDHIEALRRKGVWADFWDRAEIEGILDDNPGLVLKYPDIVSFDEFA